MPLNLKDKKALVTEVSAVAASAVSVVAAEYRGLTVTQMTDLRAKARAQGRYMRVVKNTLARKAVAGTSFECIGPALEGPAGAGLLEGGSGRRGARDQGLREGQRQAGRDTGVPRRAAAAREGHRSGREPADARTGAGDAHGCHAGADPEAGRHADAAPSKLVRTLAAVRDQRQSAGA